MSWRLSQKLVCISEDWGSGSSDLPASYLPKLNGIYTLARVDRSPCLCGRHVGEYLILHEFPPIDGVEVGYQAIMFRPVVEDEQDISVFRQIALDATVDGDLISAGDVGVSSWWS